MSTYRMRTHMRCCLLRQRNRTAALRLLCSPLALSLDLLRCSPASSRIPRLSDASFCRKPIPSYFSSFIFLSRSEVPAQRPTLTRHPRRRRATDSPLYVSTCRCFGAGLVASAQVPWVCYGGRLSASENIQNGSNNSSNSGTRASSGRASGTYGGNEKREFSTTCNSRSNEDTNKCGELPWPSAFHPLLAGLPQAVLHSARLKQQSRQQQSSSTPPPPPNNVGISTKTTAASFEAVSAVTESMGRPVAGSSTHEKPRGVLYVIHTFNLHPYEAIVFEEALYRFLGQRTTVNDRGPFPAAAAPQECRTEPAAAKSLYAQSADHLDGRSASQGDVCTSEPDDGAEVWRSLQPQQNHRLSPAVSHEQQKYCRRLHPVQQQHRQQQHRQIQAQQTASLPSVACAFLHHPPYRPACVDTTCQGSLGSMRKYHLPYPPQAVVFGLSGQPAACIRDPENVLQQQRAMFIKRFSGGGTVVIGSEDECFCVGLLLPHTFTRCRPYPRELFNVCTSLYLGEHIWEKQKCASNATHEAPHAVTCFEREVAPVPNATAPSTRSSSLRRKGAVADGSAFSAEVGEPWECSDAFMATARDVETEPAETPRRETALNRATRDPWNFTLAALSPFAASRWGFLENDYVVIYPTSSLPCASSTSTAAPDACAPSPPEDCRDCVESRWPSMACTPRIVKRQTASNSDPLQVHPGSASQVIFKVGGNAQALSRHYGLQHTSFIWDEEQLQGQLKDLLLLPAKQPKYRNNRSHMAFLRSVREGLKSRVRIAPRGFMQEQSESSEGSTCTLFAERRYECASETQHGGPGCMAEPAAVFRVDTPSRVLLSLGLLLEGHALRRNFALRLRRRRCEKASGQDAAESARRSSEKFGERSDGGSAETLQRSSGNSQAAPRASVEGWEEGLGERLQHDEEEWDCVHCVVSSDNRIPTDFKRLWADVEHFAHYRSIESPERESCRDERVHISSAVDLTEDSVGTQVLKGSFEARNGGGRRLHVLPIEAVRELVYELFEGSLKGMRTTRLIDASGSEVLEKAYSNLFAFNRIIPI